ncbi:hypothetical protein Tco_1049844, partial [Tanacetum coccineum]
MLQKASSILEVGWSGEDIVLITTQRVETRSLAFVDSSSSHILVKEIRIAQVKVTLHYQKAGWNLNHKDRPYAEDASPTAQSPDYVPKTDFEADPEEDDDEDPEGDPIDYPADRGDDGDDEMDIEAHEEDEDNDMDVEANKEEEEEHPAPTYPVIVALPATSLSAEETEPFETDEFAATPPPHPAYRMTARITIPELVLVPAWSDS